jgi:hypothetical protein
MASLPVFCFGDDRQHGFVLTVDEHDEDNPVKPLPDRPHLRVLMDLWSDSQLLIIAKSRQVMVSWGCMSAIGWEVLHPGRQWAVCCRKFEDADALLERLWGVLQRIPLTRQETNQRCRLWNGTAIERKQGLITVWHEGAPSRVLALAEDSDAPRSRTFSGILIDEAAFTSNLDSLYAAAKPTTMAGGKLVLGSSPNGRGLFYDLLTDSGRVAL